MNYFENLKDDINKFSKLTGIPDSKLKTDDISLILREPDIYTLKLTPVQREKIEYIREIMSEYRIVRHKKYTSSLAIGEYFAQKLSMYTVEHFAILALNTASEYQKFKTFEGTTDQVHVYMKELVKFAILNNAKKVIIGHNHLGGSLSPSGGDITITKRIRDAFELVDIQVIDHIIVIPDTLTTYYSFAENGTL